LKLDLKPDSTNSKMGKGGWRGGTPNEQARCIGLTVIGRQAGAMCGGEEVAFKMGRAVRSWVDFVDPFFRRRYMRDGRLDEATEGVGRRTKRNTLVVEYGTLLFFLSSREVL
jgi:hypothetical protein